MYIGLKHIYFSLHYIKAYYIINKYVDNALSIDLQHKYHAAMQHMCPDSKQTITALVEN